MKLATQHCSDVIVLKVRLLHRRHVSIYEELISFANALEAVSVTRRMKRQGESSLKRKSDDVSELEDVEASKVKRSRVGTSIVEIISSDEEDTGCMYRLSSFWLLLKSIVVSKVLSGTKKSLEISKYFKKRAFSEIDTSEDDTPRRERKRRISYSREKMDPELQQNDKEDGSLCLFPVKSGLIIPPRRSSTSFRKSKAIDLEDHKVHDHALETNQQKGKSLEERTPSHYDVPETSKSVKEHPKPRAISLCTPLHYDVPETSQQKGKSVEECTSSHYNAPETSKSVKEHPKPRAITLSPAHSSSYYEQDDTPYVSYPFSGKGAISVTKQDMLRLNEGEFLNDTIIDFYLQWFADELEKTSPEVAKNTHIFNSFFYKRLTQPKSRREKPYDSVRKWTSKVNLFDKKYAIVPINEK
ncbi:hypothetical protein DFQ29_004705 [Apophysomyces sp. BC1021]|nr:hypothetical protein DFQ29_004705 [Apophysomyces sp. BC1021]